ncbi:MAG: hypothetical protein ABIH52_02350 [Candidatus Aenigmatarchaeota archaeon]
MLELTWDSKHVFATDPETVEKLRKNHFGTYKNKKLFLEIEEALYLINFQNAVCKSGDKEVGFNQLASEYAREDPRFFIKYNAFRDWRDREDWL